jgi:hypothetical protein
MTDQTRISEPQLATSEHPKHDSPPVVETVIPADASSRVRGPVSVEDSTAGRGALIAWLVIIPAVVAMLLFAGFWVYPAMKSTTEDGGVSHGQPPMSTPQSK